MYRLATVDYFTATGGFYCLREPRGFPHKMADCQNSRLHSEGPPAELQQMPTEELFSVKAWTRRGRYHSYQWKPPRSLTTVWHSKGESAWTTTHSPSSSTHRLTLASAPTPLATARWTVGPSPTAQALAGGDDCLKKHWHFWVPQHGPAGTILTSLQAMVLGTILGPYREMQRRSAAPRSRSSRRSWAPIPDAAAPEVTVKAAFYSLLVS